MRVASEQFLPQILRRTTSIRLFMTVLVVLMLVLLLGIAGIGFFSLQSVQTEVENNLQEASRIRELSLALSNEFLSARQSETDFMNSSQEIGYYQAFPLYGAANQKHLRLTRTLLDELQGTVVISADEQFRAFNPDLEALRPLLDTYGSTFQSTMDNIEWRSREGGLEDILNSQWQELERLARQPEDYIYLEITFKIRENERAFYMTGRQEYVDNIRILSNRFIRLVNDEILLGIDVGIDVATGQAMIDQMNLCLETFSELAALHRSIEINTTIFREVTTEINQTTSKVVEECNAGLQRAEARLQTIAQRSSAVLIAGSMIGVILGAGLATNLAQRIINPINQLTQAATRFGQGDLKYKAGATQVSEINQLSETFNLMAEQLSQTLEGLEGKVAERTEDLRRRAVQLRVAAEVAREAAAIRDRKSLFERIVNIISQRFNFYHAGILLIDDTGEFAVLQAASSSGGQKMIARGHKLKVGQMGIVGTVADTGRPRIALDVGADAVYFSNPDLPDTHSEIALPLKVSGKVIGVLDVQATQVSAFHQEDIETLQILSDQLALALENARLFEESQQTLAELNRIYGEQILLAWSERLKQRPFFYQYTHLGVKTGEREKLAEIQIPHEASIASDDTHHTLVIPLLIRGQALGALLFHREITLPPWTEDEKVLVQETMAQVTPALENARLFEETQIRAAREQTVNIISTQVRSAANLEAILQNTVRELGKALGVSRTFIQFGSSETQIEAESQVRSIS